MCYEQVIDDNAKPGFEPQEVISTGSLGTFAESPSLIHLSLSAHTIFNGSSERNLTALLPPRLQLLTITDDLHWLDVQMCFGSPWYLAILRAYLIGETVLERYESDDNRELASESIVTRKGENGGQWVASTSGLIEVVFDIRREEERRTGYCDGARVEVCFVEGGKEGRVASEVWRRVGK
jgi:hypothetical protein